MPRAGLDKITLIRRAVELANTHGLSYVTMKTMAEDFNIKTPSLYNHIASQEELYTELMIFGWEQLSDLMYDTSTRYNGIEAIKEVCRVFYKYFVSNPGLFEAMLEYNKYKSERLNSATDKIYWIFFSVMESLGIGEEKANHLLRTFRAFIEGFAICVIHNSFGSPLSIEESFEYSLNVLITGILEEEKK